MTDIERARAKRDLRNALASSLRLSDAECPLCSVSWSLHSVEQVVSHCEALASAQPNHNEGA